MSLIVVSVPLSPFSSLTSFFVVCIPFRRCRPCLLLESLFVVVVPFIPRDIRFVLLGRSGGFSSRRSFLIPYRRSSPFSSFESLFVVVVLVCCLSPFFPPLAHASPFEPFRRSFFPFVPFIPPLSLPHLPPAPPPLSKKRRNGNLASFPANTVAWPPDEAAEEKSVGGC